MHLKRKSPKQRLSVKKTCLRDEKVAANSLLMLSESSGAAGKTNDEIFVAEILSSFVDSAGNKESVNVVADSAGIHVSGVTESTVIDDRSDHAEEIPDEKKEQTSGQSTQVNNYIFY